MRALLISLVVVLSALTLTGCSPALGGFVAIGVDRDGDPILVTYSCNGPADSILVRSTPESADPEAEDWIDGLYLENPEPRFSDPASVSLTDPDRRWAIVDPGEGFMEGWIYDVRAWPSNGNVETLRSVMFTTGQLAEIGEGEVLVNDDGGYMIEPVDEFMESSREWCEDSYEQ